MAASLSRINQCPHCGRKVTGHKYILLASDVVDKEKRHLRDFFESFESHDWRKLLTSQRWEGRSDNVEVYVVLCGADSAVLVAIRSPFELFDNDEILAIDALGQGKSKDLLEWAKDENWKTIE